MASLTNTTHIYQKKLHANLPLEGITETIKKDPKEVFIVESKGTLSEERTNSIFAPIEGVIPVVQNGKYFVFYK